MGKRGKGGGQSNKAAVVKTKPTTPASPAVINQMQQAYGTTSYSPNAPLLPYPGLQPAQGPRQFAYPIATNLNLVTRDNLTPFQILRSLADLYDGIRICKQSWFDCAAGLEPDIVPAPGLLGKNETADKYADEIAVYIDFFESPDRQHTIHEWMNAALDDLVTIDAVAMYPRLTYGGELYSLDLIDGSTIKPLLDDRGRAPAPPFYAYEQIVYGAPSELFTSDELIYLKEHHRTYSEFGFSRVENILMRTNQALRKQSLDMAMFTDGNIPAGFVSPAADLGWTPDQLNAFQTILDSLYAGNDALRSRLKMMPPGSSFTPTNPISVVTDFDLFLFNVTCASFGTTPADAGFTQDVNRSSGETQADVLYRRTLKPIALRFARLFNFILKKYFNERRFLFQWKGYEAAEDFGALVTAHTQLVSTGIETAGNAALALKLPEQGPDVPRFIMTKDGPFVVDDLANKQLNDMKQQAQMAGLQLAAKPQQPPQEDDGQPNNDGNEQAQDDKPNSQDDTASGDDEQEQNSKQSATVKRSADTSGDTVQTGMMLAFMLDGETANRLALPGGEPPSNLHITLAYLGDMEDAVTDDKLRAHTSPFKIREVVTMIAAQAQPLSGVVGGIGRFFPAETETTPIIALVDVDGLVELRTKLVEAIESAGYFVADNHGYTPHITLDYIDASAPMPIEQVPALPLNLHAITLCIGNDRYEFLIGDPVYEQATEEEAERLARADLRRWRDYALSRVTAGKALRPFVSQHVPARLSTQIARALDGCSTPAEVRLVFRRAADGQPLWQPVSQEQQQIEASMQHAILTALQQHDTDTLISRLTTLLEQAYELGHNQAARLIGKPERMQRGAWGGVLGRIKGVLHGIAHRQQEQPPQDQQQSDETQLEDDSVYADMVAQNEAQYAVQQGGLDLYNQYGLPVQWVTDGNPCPVCITNAEAGVHVAGVAFPSGDESPPAHPRCRCQLQPADGYEME